MILKSTRDAFIDQLPHPILGLIAAACCEGTVRDGDLVVFEDRVPNLDHALPLDGTRNHRARSPFVVHAANEIEGARVIHAGSLGRRFYGSIGLIHN